jgi:hypothetical protein
MKQLLQCHLEEAAIENFHDILLLVSKKFLLMISRGQAAHVRPTTHDEIK